MEKLGSPEDRFVLNDDLPMLQEIASYSVAQSIWNSYISRSKPRTDSMIPYYHNTQQFLGLNEDYRYDCDEMVAYLKTPTSIEKLLKNALDKVAKEMIRWIDKIFIFIDVRVHDSNCVWLANGKIDEKQSVMTMLSNGNQLSDVQKFTLMCEFCLEDEIVKFPINSLPEDYLTNTNYPCSASIIYWFYYAKKELLRLWRPRQRGFSTIGELALNCDAERFVAFEYFWHRMDSGEQMSVVTEIFSRYRDDFKGCLDRLLSLMSWQQQRQLLSTDHTGIVWKLIFFGKSVKSSRWIWTHYKDLITGEILFNIVVYLFQDIRLDDEEFISWLVDVWEAASDESRNFAVGTLENLPLRSYALSHNRPSRSGFEFLCKILSMFDVNWRKSIMLEEAHHFNIEVIGNNSIVELMKICLPNVDDQSEFKKLLAESDDLKHQCVKLIKYSNFDRLNAALEFCLPTSNDVRVFKKMLLETGPITRVNFLYNIKRWNALCKFINEVYPENDSLVLQTKKKLIASFLSTFSPFELNGTSDVTHLIQIVESELTEKEVEALKHSLFYSFESKLKDNRHYQWYMEHLNEMYFRRFVKWCVGDDDGAVLKYGDGTFVDTVFDGVLDVLYESLHPSETQSLQLNESLLFNLDQCLLWYLTSDENVKKYKMSRISSPCVLKIYLACSKQKCESMSPRVFLKWFFDGDESQIRIFNSMHLVS